MALVNINHHSYYLGMDIPITILLPEKRGCKPVSQPERKYPVLYLLHGHADDNTAWIRKSDLELFVRDYDLIVVMPNGHRGFYTNGACGHHYMDYIAKELPVVMSNFFHASQRREDNYIAGLSMGGYGALKIGLTYPKQYAALGAMSAAIDPFQAIKMSGKMFTVPDAIENVSWIFGAEADYAKSHNSLTCIVDNIAQTEGDIPRIYHSCGKQDSLYQMNVELKELLEKQDSKLEYHYSESDGEHNWAFWNPELKKILEFMKLI